MSTILEKAEHNERQLAEQRAARRAQEFAENAAQSKRNEIARLERRIGQFKSLLNLYRVIEEAIPSLPEQERASLQFIVGTTDRHADKRTFGTPGNERTKKDRALESLALAEAELAELKA
jgi:hypothetical protein